MDHRKMSKVTLTTHILVTTVILFISVSKVYFPDYATYTTDDFVNVTLSDRLKTVITIIKEQFEVFQSTISYSTCLQEKLSFFRNKESP